MLDQCRIVFLLAALLSGAARGAEQKLLLCSDNHPHPPHMLLNGEGTAQVLVRNAARRAGLEVEFRTAPVVRCVEELKLNLNQGYPLAAYSDTLKDMCSFPMRNNSPDPQRATVILRARLYRRVGDAVGWNGRQLTGPSRRVLTQRTQMKVAERLDKLSIAYDSGADDASINFAKLVAGRGDVVIAYESDAQPILKTPQFAGKIEALPLAFVSEPFFLCLSKPFHDADPERAQRLWDHIGRMNNLSGNAGAQVPIR